MAMRPDASTIPPTKLGPSNFRLLAGVGATVVVTGDFVGVSFVVVTGGTGVGLFVVVVALVVVGVGFSVVVALVGGGVGLTVVVVFGFLVVVGIEVDVFAEIEKKLLQLFFFIF